MSSAAASDFRALCFVFIMIPLPTCITTSEFTRRNFPFERAWGMKKSGWKDEFDGFTGKKLVCFDFRGEEVELTGQK